MINLKKKKQLLTKGLKQMFNVARKKFVMVKMIIFPSTSFFFYI